MRILFLLLFVIPNFSFGQNSSLKIEVVLKGMPDNTLFYLTEEKQNIDSCFSKSENLTFTYNKKTILPTGLLLISKDRKQGYIIWIENIPINLQGIYKDLSPLSTVNSITQKEFQEYMLSTTSINDSLSFATKRYRNLRSSLNPDSLIYEKKITNLSSQLKQVNIDFINNHPNSIISTQTLFFEATQKRFSNEEVIKCFKILSKDQQNSSVGQGILKSTFLYQSPEIGKKAPDFSMTDTKGNSVSLSSFKGKNILLIFWASWCAPCIKEMHEILKTYQKIKGHNIIFIAVSLDEKKESWLKSIKQNSIEFLNLSDLKGWMNEAALIYGVSGVPDNFLINSDGNLVERQRGFESIKNRILALTN